MQSPFKFLDAYTKEDKDIFFGRDNEIEELYQKVFDSKVLMICGVSGTGKTSLINCGLANKFEESDWLPINIRRGGDIISSLKAGISKLAITKGKETQSICKQLQSLYLDHFKPIYLIFDQFEEVFIFGNREERQEFIAEIKKIIDSDVQCRLLFVLREEYLAGAIEFEREIPTILTNRIRIEKMTWHNAKQVIEEPCKVHGIAVEENLSDNILGKLSPESIEVELTYLQVLLDKLYRMALNKEKEKPVFSNELLSEAGDVSDLLGSFLEEQIDQLDDPETGLVILKSFVSVKGTKRQVTNENINDFASILGKKISEEELKNLIQKFINLRILRDKDESGRYELRHDSLASKIYEKITLVEKELLEIKEFLDNAYQNYDRRGILMSEYDLKYIAPYEDKIIISRLLVQFINDSKKNLLKARRRRRRALVVIAITMIIVLTFFTGWALNERSKAIEQSKIAEKQSVEAINARDDSEKSRMQAENATDEALFQKTLADSALIVAKSERNVAQNQRSIADHQRRRAEALLAETNEQRKIAEDARSQAEDLAEEILQSSKEAMLQLYLFNANEFANQSLLMERDDTLKALLAIYAYDLFNYGYEKYSDIHNNLVYDIQIIEALQKAFLNLESDLLLEGEVWALDTKNEFLVLSNEGNSVSSYKIMENKFGIPQLSLVNTQHLDYIIDNQNRLDYSAYNSIIKSVSIDQLQSRVVCGSADGDVFLIQYDSSYNLKNVLKLYNHSSRILCTAVLDSAESIVSSSKKSLILWDIRSDEIIDEVETEFPITKIVDIGQGNPLLVCEDAKLYIYNLEIQSIEVFTQFTSQMPVYSVEYNHKNDILIIAGSEELILLNLNAHDEDSLIKYRIRYQSFGMISSMDFSSDAKWITMGFLDGTVLLWNLAEERLKLEGAVKPIIITNQNRRIISTKISQESNYLVYSDLNDVKIYPLSFTNAYNKLKGKLKGKDLTKDEWNAYSQGNIFNPRESGNDK